MGIFNIFTDDTGQSEQAKLIDELSSQQLKERDREVRKILDGKINALREEEKNKVEGQDGILKA